MKQLFNRMLVLFGSLVVSIVLTVSMTTFSSYNRIRRLSKHNFVSNTTQSIYLNITLSNNTNNTANNGDISDTTTAKETSSFDNSSKTLLCIVGNVRTFALRQAHESIYNNVYLSLGGPEKVDVNFVLIYKENQESTGSVTYGAQTCYNETAIRHAIDMFSPKSVRVLDRSNCNEFQRVWSSNGTIGPRYSCVENNFFLQVANIDQCFTDVSRQYDNYIRVRPDSFFASPVVQVAEEYNNHYSSSIDQKAFNTIITWPKFDAPASDQFFMVSKQMYEVWWQGYVVQKRLVMGSLKKQPPEYTIFHGFNVTQNNDIEGCVLRSHDKVDCWRKPPGDDVKNKLRYRHRPTPDQYMADKLLRYPSRDESCGGAFPQQDQLTQDLLLI